MHLIISNVKIIKLKISHVKITNFSKPIKSKNFKKFLKIKIISLCKFSLNRYYKRLLFIGIISKPCSTQGTSTINAITIGNNIVQQ